MMTDSATSYVAIHARHVFHGDRIACTTTGAPIHTRLALNEALAHERVVWKTVEDHFVATDKVCPPLVVPVPDGSTLIVWDDESDVTVPVDAILYAHQS